MLKPRIATVLLSSTLLLAAGLSPTAVQADPQPDERRATCGGKRATIVGTNGDDVIRGTRRPDVIHGRGGSDRIYGFGKRDRLCGGGGVDLLDGGKSMDRLWGGKGHDYCAGPHREHQSGWHRQCEAHIPPTAPPPPPLP